MTKIQYSAGIGQQSTVWSERIMAPNNQPSYNDDWRLVATDLALDFYENHEGHNCRWPLNIIIYADNERVWNGDVALEMEPYFYVV